MATPPLPGSTPTAPPQPNIVESPTIGGSAPKQATVANVKKSPFRFLPLVLGALVVVGGIAFAASKLLGNKPASVGKTGTEQAAPAAAPSKQVTLTYWGLWEPDSVLTDVLKEFQQKNPGITVNYVKQSPQNYRERLQTAVASGNGPDLFRYHVTWVPMLKDELGSMPQSVMSAGEYKEAFYPVAVRHLQNEGKIVGVPLMYDGLGLYYNKEMLKAASAEPPRTWAELKTLAAKLTVRNGNEVQRGGLAIGNTSNVEHFSDILGLLMLQNGADPADASSDEVRDAMIFYTNFMKENQVWSDSLPSSTVAFARGDVAMMMAPSWRAHEIKAMNPDRDFGIVPVPRLGGSTVGWASFWAEGVSSKSKASNESWALLKYLSSKEVLQKLYASQSKTRTFGEIYPRKDMADMLANDELVAPFLQDAPNAQTWYLASQTHDNGLNDQLIKYYEDAINSVLAGKTAEDVLGTVDQGTTQVLRQYGVKTTP
jgi:multiple sugar transport system substrate-binding protein